MTTLYRPVLIESAEQADALPAGALLHRARGNLQTGLVGMVLRSPYTDRSYYRVGVDHWPVRRVVETFAEALVPIEAEEEWEDDGRPVWNIGEGEATPADVDDYERRNGRRPSRRLVTPWEVTR